MKPTPLTALLVATIITIAMPSCVSKDPNQGLAVLSHATGGLIPTGGSPPNAAAGFGTNAVRYSSPIAEETAKSQAFWGN